VARIRDRPPGRLLLAACLLAATASVHAEPGDAVERSVQAAYLYQFLRFVEWPEADAGAPLAVCVVGKDPFGNTLDLAVQGRRVGARKVTVVRLPDAEAAATCDLLFLPAGETARLPALQRAIGDHPVLLVSDAGDFARNGGMIGFFRDADRLRFEVNPDAAEIRGLRISSRLLAIARVVRDSAAIRK
jgi:hypothetical protein